MAYEITYTYFGKERPVFIAEAADTPETALAVFRQAKPGVPVSEINEPRKIHEKPQQDNQKRIESGRRRISALTPESISDELIGYLRSLPPDEIRLRFSYPADVESAVKERFSELGLSLPYDIRPMDSGSRGSVHVMYRT